jgi:hypothetical protein
VGVLGFFTPFFIKIKDSDPIDFKIKDPIDFIDFGITLQKP